MAEYLIQGETLDNIANAINARTGGSAAMTPAEMADAIAAIQTGGGSEIETTDYVLTEDWSTNDLGNTQNFYNTFCNKGDGLYVFMILNNGIANSDLYKAISAVSWTGITKDAWAVSRRVFNDVTQVNTTMGFHMSIGTTIRQYYMAKGVFGL